MANIGRPERTHEIVPDVEPVGVPAKLPYEEPITTEEPVYVPTRQRD